MDELTLARQQLEFDRRELTVAKQQAQLDKERFEFEKQQFSVEQQKIRKQLQKQQTRLDQQKQQFQHYLQLQLQSHIVSSNMNSSLLDSIIACTSQTYKNDNCQQQPPPIATLALEDMINKSNHHLDIEVQNYHELAKKLRASTNKLKRSERAITQRVSESKKCLKRNRFIQRCLMSYCRYIKSRHDLTIKALSTNRLLKDRNEALTRRAHQLKESLDEANYEEKQFAKKDTPLLQKEFILNSIRWKTKEKSEKLVYLVAMKEYNEKKEKEGKENVTIAPLVEPKKEKLKASLLIKLINIDKKICISYDFSSSWEPLLAFTYKTPGASSLPLCDHFFKKHYDNGTIPKLTDDLKLFFSSKHIDDGRWVQFHGPGKEVDGGKWDHPVNILSPLNPFKIRSIKSTSDQDRCELSKDECERQHKETDLNYAPYHSSPQGIYTSQYEISLKWE